MSQLNENTGKIQTLINKISNLPKDRYEDGHNNGYEIGYQEGNVKGVEQGKQAEYDRFWDSFQQNGERAMYGLAFAGVGWKQDTLKPKYLIKPNSATSEKNNGVNQMFSLCNWNQQPLIDYSLIKDKFDFSECTKAPQLFSNAWIDNIDVDLSNCTELYQTFGHGNNGSTPNIRLKVSEKAVFNRTFYWNSANVTFTEDSVIGQNGLDLVRSTTMEKSHLTSVINALSTTTSGLAVTLSLQAVDKAFETSEGANDGSTSEEWTTLVNTKKNWTINLS